MEILEQSGRIDDIVKNPQDFLDKVCDVISQELQVLMIDGIQYHKIENADYEMTLFTLRELEIYENKFTFFVTNKDKTIYENIIPLDSAIEKQFAQDCESSEQIRYYFKLPNWFKIKTPIGNYNPDWALVFKDNTKIYFVAETKDTGDKGVIDYLKLRESEKDKIACAKKYFKEMDNIRYKVVSNVSDLFQS